MFIFEEITSVANAVVLRGTVLRVLAIFASTMIIVLMCAAILPRSHTQHQRAHQRARVRPHAALVKRVHIYQAQNATFVTRVKSFVTRVSVLGH
jgi:hypothetical protein